MKKEKYYYQVHLEVVLKGADFVFGFINISHIPFEKFEEMFLDQVKQERFLFDEGMGYAIKKKTYLKHKKYLDKEVPFTFDFKLFSYSVHLTGDKLDKLPKWYYEKLPNYFSETKI
ncbi:hypothetical protein VRU48_15100 [Pedobacter sp. KR3-3]|uniref:Uncharacterized protein n=1 Tax=Pedobacter albus TaxID=3113905 RepID=A0ABU7IAE4_9SPHI|nr:hypothetical protein [Pedobacter sp. KR3-3]MEE1946450.1 hypothetical protein [Pedobacter sp. KR3-3]